MIKPSLKSQKGQTLVEYILLLVVAISLVLTFYRSEAFRRLFGEQGRIGQNIKSQNEFAYRHAFSSSGVARTRPPDVSRDNKDGGTHPSYYDDVNGGSRFFGPKDPYGE